MKSIKSLAVEGHFDEFAVLLSSFGIVFRIGVIKELKLKFRCRSRGERNEKCKL